MLLVISAIVIAAGAGAATTHYATRETPQREAKSLMTEVHELAQRNADSARRYIIGAIDTCLPDKARKNWTGGEIKILAADVYLKSFDLMSQELTKEDRNAQFRKWVLKEHDRLTKAQRDRFAALMREDGFYKGETMACVAFAVRGLLQS